MSFRQNGLHTNRHAMRNGEIAGFTANFENQAPHTRGLPMRSPMTLRELRDNVPGFNRRIEARELHYYTTGAGPVPAGIPTIVGDRVALCEEQSEICVGIVSPKYAVLQDADALAALEHLVSEHDGKVVQAALLDNGSKSYVQIQLRDFEAEVRPGDSVKKLLTFYNSFDGSTRPMISDADIRIICDNQLSAFRASGVTISHRGDIRSKFGALVSALQLSFRNRVELFRALAGKPVTQRDITAYLERFCGNPAACESKAKAARIERKIGEIERLFSAGIDNRGATLWDLVNAATEYTTHTVTSKGWNVNNHAKSLMFGAKGEECSFAVAVASDML